MKKQKPITEVELCSVCLERFEDCLCEDIFNEEDLLRRDDDHVASGLGIY